MAYSGFSYMALAWANFINIIVSGATYAIFRPKDAPWLPSFSGWGKVADFGAGAIVGGILGQIKTRYPKSG